MKKLFLTASLIAALTSTRSQDYVQRDPESYHVNVSLGYKPKEDARHASGLLVEASRRFENGLYDAVGVELWIPPKGFYTGITAGGGYVISKWSVRPVTAFRIGAGIHSEGAENYPSMLYYVLEGGAGVRIGPLQITGERRLLGSGQKLIKNNAWNIKATIVLNTNRY